MAKKTLPKFRYVIARPWDDASPTGALCIYAYGNEIQEGDMNGAKAMLDYVRRMQQDEPKKAASYGIYVVSLTKIAD